MPDQTDQPPLPCVPAPERAPRQDPPAEPPARELPPDALTALLRSEFARRTATLNDRSRS